MTVLESIILGLVQGLTEFLPVSSSGHLVVTEKLLGLPPGNLRFIVAVHLGSLLAVLAVYRVQVGRLLKGILCGRIRRKNGRWRFSNPDTRLALLLGVGTVPAAVFGYLFASRIEEAFSQPRFVGFSLLVTGTVIFSLRFARDRKGEPNFFRAILVGLAQAAAIFPGISRSGMTISAGVHSGIERTRAADFSFLLSIPIILGAGLFKFLDDAGEGLPRAEIAVLLIGALAAAVSGYLAIRILLRLIKKKKLHYFGYYCWLAGLAVLALTL
ncbi:MAG: undecaprenyl-diphosphate phosphatase [Candidatus Erginobacter occultus]|nr:undecaprenyl-diphosphate phosphatase [Candidatus Erginobacter occultus]